MALGSTEWTGGALRRLRERRDISRTAVAMALGWNFRRLDQIERGSRAVRYVEVLALLELYGNKWSELQAIEDEASKGERR